MRVFGEYANHYDALYADKDYVSEADFVAAAIRRYVPDASSILDLGCGSARHALALVNRGFSVLGIERSAEMLVLAREHVLYPRALRWVIDDALVINDGVVTHPGGESQLLV